MKMSQWGEQKFIEYLAKEFPIMSQSIGIGDDCAVIAGEGGTALLVTTDALVEGVHFLTDLISPKDLGYKMVAVNVSDIASMGGSPSSAFLSIALPRDTDCDWIKSFTSGMKEACDQFKLDLLGGDTVGSKRDVFLNFTVLGKVDTSHVKYRTSAKQGDIICVTGYLGDSLGGLRAFQDKLPNSTAIDHLIQAHVHPRIHLPEGVWLGAQRGVRAMMDISDGLDCDLQRMIEASNCSAEIDVEKIPLSSSLKEVSRKHGWNATEIGIIGGEDYALLLTIAPENFEKMAHLYAEQFKEPLHPIGRIRAEATQINYVGSEGFISLPLKRYDHFER